MARARRDARAAEPPAILKKLASSKLTLEGADDVGSTVTLRGEEAQPGAVVPFVLNAPCRTKRRLQATGLCGDRAVLLRS